MDTLTIILLCAIGVFIIGNILVSIMLGRIKKTLSFGTSYNAKIDVLKSKIDVLNNRVTRLEANLKK
jgi:outer membrane murein-binding lipoprotein Lpp